MFPYGYQSAYQQAYQQNPYQQNQPMQRYDVIKVNGKNGAEAFQMAPNSSVLLLDETSPIVWLKQTDGAGYPTLSPYSITPYQPEPQVSMGSLEARISRLEDIINGKSYVESNELSQNATANSAVQTNNANTKIRTKSTGNA